MSPLIPSATTAESRLSTAASSATAAPAFDLLNLFQEVVKELRQAAPAWKPPPWVEKLQADPAARGLLACETARKLVAMFQKNFVQFETHVDADVRDAQPEVRIAAE